MHRLLILILALLLGGCGLAENQSLKDENQRLQGHVTKLEDQVSELQKYSKEVAEALAQHESGLQREWQAEQIFRDDLDKAAACKVIFELPLICEPSLAAARAKTLAKANAEGVSATHGNRYWGTVAGGAAGVVFVFFVTWAGLVLLGSARSSTEEAENAMELAQEEINRAKKEGAAHMANLQGELDSLKKKIEAAKQEIADLEEEQRESEQAADEAHERAEQAEQAAADLQKKLDLLKAFK